MKEAVAKSVQLNEHIKASEEYRRYIETKKALCDNMVLYNQLKEFKVKNYELQNIQGVNPYDEMIGLAKQYDELLHNSIVNDYLRAEQRICKLMQQVYEAIADGLEFE